jgi:hypothetical protein
MIRRIIQKYDTWFVVLWGVILFVPFLNAVHLFDWDEINFAESAREMLVTGNYQAVQINYQPFMEKPPLFFWCQVLSMKLFGVNEFAARFPNAIVGIITLVLAFFIGKKIHGRTFGFLWVLFVTGSFTPHLYFKSGIIDPLYNLFVFLAMYQFYLYLTNDRAIKNTIYIGLFIGLAIITKGPVALIVIGLVVLVYWALQKFSAILSLQHLLLATVSAFVVAASWFGIEMVNHGPTFLLEFVKYQADLFLNPVAGHGQPVYYHALVLLVGAFPSSIFALKQLVKKPSNEVSNDHTWTLLLFIQFWVVLILFSIVKTKIVHYSSLCYLPIAFFAAKQLLAYLNQKETMPFWQKTLAFVLAISIAMLFVVLPFVDSFKYKLIPLIEDNFAKGNLSITGTWNGMEFLPGLFFIGVAVVFFIKLLKKELINAAFLLLFFLSFFIPVVLRLIVPKIEQYTQGAAIEFYEQKAKEDCYIETVGFKSYAHYFYAKVSPEHAITTSKGFNYNGSLTKPMYLVCKQGNEQAIDTNFVQLYQKGGFVFYVKK